MLIVSTLLIRLPGRPEIKKNIHSAVMFILLIVNPGLIVAFSETFLSILWALSISTFLLYCLLFIRFRKKDVRITTVPFFTFLMHFLYRVANGKMETDILFLALFGFLMSCFYALFYHMFKFCLDNNHESLSVYLDNNEIAEFLEGYRLTCREQEICSCIINGYSAKTTAEKLSIAEGTVKNHTKKIYRKIGINGRMELMHLVWDFSLLKK
ncbi:MAG: helix-turn-helix transcriptional regulator [Spirochaetales bacterium]|nr:helix-turn-helix transcriptional regulator [Spirochaetales bacterium]